MDGGPKDPAAQPVAEQGRVRKKPTRAEINKIIKLHQDYRNGVFGGRRASLSFHDLEGMLFAGADLKDANLTDAKTDGADFTDAAGHIRP